MEFPTGSGKEVTLGELIDKINNRLVNIFRKDRNGNRPVHALQHNIYKEEHFKDIDSIL